MKRETIYVLMPVEVTMITDETGSRVGSVTMPRHEQVKETQEKTNNMCNFKAWEDAEEVESVALEDFFYIE